LRAQHPARGIEPHQLGVLRRADLHLGFDGRPLAGHFDHELLAVDAVRRGCTVDLRPHERQAVAIETQRPVVRAVAFDAERGANASPFRIEVELEAHLRHEPVGRPIILAADRNVGGRERGFRSGLGVGKRRGANIGHDRDLSAADDRNNPRAGASVRCRR
jgi:hypothetical protein